ncbi:MAG: antibiotic biosynthesis monooxygenase family protein [Rhodothermales bacterium]
MIIVSGKLYIQTGQRDAFVTRSTAAVVAARQTPGCRDFAVSPDPVDPDRVNIFEEWESMEALEAFRGSGPDDPLFALIVRADIAEREL